MHISGSTLGYWSGSNGTYNLSGGSLSAPYEIIGVHGVGTFNQTGGLNTMDTDLTLGSGTYRQRHL